MDTRPKPDGPSGQPIDDNVSVTEPAVILAVDRDPHIRALLEHFLTDAGYSVEFASGGAAAVDRAQELRPDVVVTELLLPDLDGLQLCTRLKGAPELRDTRIVVFSLLSAREQAREAGADAFVRKPLSEVHLVDVVKNLLAADSKPDVREGA